MAYVTKDMKIDILQGKVTTLIDEVSELQHQVCALKGEKVDVLMLLEAANKAVVAPLVASNSTPTDKESTLELQLNKAQDYIKRLLLRVEQLEETDTKYNELVERFEKQHRTLAEKENELGDVEEERNTLKEENERLQDVQDKLDRLVEGICDKLAIPASETSAYLSMGNVDAAVQTLVDNL